MELKHQNLEESGRILSIPHFSTFSRLLALPQFWFHYCDINEYSLVYSMDLIRYTLIQDQCSLSWEVDQQSSVPSLWSAWDELRGTGLSSPRVLCNWESHMISSKGIPFKTLSCQRLLSVHRLVLWETIRESAHDEIQLQLLRQQTLITRHDQLRMLWLPLQVVIAFQSSAPSISCDILQQSQSSRCLWRIRCSSLPLPRHQCKRVALDLL